MKNYLVSKIFYEIADMLEMKDEPFKPQSYRNVARTIEEMPQDIEETYRKNQLSKIPGVGKNVKKKVEELIKTGGLEYHKNLRKEIPVDLEDLLSIEGLGPRMIKILYEELGVKTIKDLEKVTKFGQTKEIFHFGEKYEKKILFEIKFFKRREGRFLLGSTLPLAREILERFKRMPEVKKVQSVGSLRRGKEVVGDIDILVESNNPKKVMEAFTQVPERDEVLSENITKSSIKLHSGVNVSLKVVSKDSFGAAMQYFTGSKEHNVELRKLALSKKLKLNEYGIFKKSNNNYFKKIATKDEADVYKILGLKYVDPELRECRGEIKAAKNNKLPKLINQGDLKGDLHIHTKWSEGSATLEQMAEEARRRGLEYIAITDHAGHLEVASAMDRKKLLQQMKEIDKINLKLSEKYPKRKGTRLLKGAEVDIKKDGNLDMDDDVLSKLDLVVVSIHSDLRMSKNEMTKRVIKAMQNPYVSILAHPTGRIIRRRESCDLDLKKVFKEAREKRIALEINSFPERLDLKDEDAREAIKNGVKLVISSDSHSLRHLPLIEYGVITARRGWAEKNDILNTMSADKLLEWFKN